MPEFYKQKTITGRARSTPAAPPIPSQIGPYKIESLLNRGGMSLLYLGAQPGSSQPIVIKVLLPRYVKNRETTSRFLKEAHIIGITNHPNIVKLYGEGQWEQGLYIAMEFIQGISLRQFIQQKSLSHKRALEIVLQVAYALCHLHTHGVIHRDLKPENILITESGEVKVIDFGIAQLQEELPHPVEGFMGTPVYMSPEQKELPPRIFYSSDIYALGIIAYELLLGRLSHGVIQLTLLPKPIQAILDKALKADPKERYPDIVDLITDIAQYLKSPLVDAPIGEEELIDMLEEARPLMVPKHPPSWSPAQIGLAMSQGALLNRLYLDFFHLPEQRLAIVLAESIGKSSLFHPPIFRGMMRMSITQHLHNKKEPHPIQMLHILNRSLHEDPMQGSFKLSLLMLYPDRDQLFFASCRSGTLIHIPEGSRAVRRLSTPNPALGSDPNASLLEISDNWNSGDLLMLHPSDPSRFSDEELLRLRPLSVQSQADKILHAIFPTQPSNSSETPVAITILRT